MIANRFGAYLLTAAIGAVAAVSGLMSCGGGGSSSAAAIGPGTLDASFGAAGVVQIDLSSGLFVQKIAVQSDAKIVLAGTKGTQGTDADVLIVRLNPDGTPDMGFGASGIRTVDLGSTNDLANGLELRPGGKILVGAFPGAFPGDCHAALIQLDSAGALDGSFAAGGIFNLQTTNGGLAVCPSSLAIQPADGKIVVGGTNFNDFVLGRFTAAGAVDSSFGTGGLVTTDFGPDFAGVSTILSQVDGKIVAAGQFLQVAGQTTTDTVLAARYDPAAGVLDTGFGASGKAVLTLSPSMVDSEFVPRMVQLADGKLLLLALPNSDTTDGTRLVRLTTAGTLDGTFGAGGSIDLDYLALDIIRVGDKVYVVGTRISGSGTVGVLQRLSVDGGSDTAFGTGGEVTLQPETVTILSAVAVQPDGKIVVAGRAVTAGGEQLLFARYYP
jgi:uncharacterized delta-60 repeat protein